MSLNGSAQSIGSPSRMRGKEGDELGLGQTIRITPACAGKRKDSGRTSSRSRDHPRVCGEKPFPQLESTVPPGSPPRMRGKVQTVCPLAHLRRITPACAGKRIKLRKRHSICGDHPRVCGEKTKPVPAGGILMGSPPRMRGKEVGLGVRTSRIGITPAYAGKSKRTDCR